MPFSVTDPVDNRSLRPKRRRVRRKAPSPAQTVANFGRTVTKSTRRVTRKTVKPSRPRTPQYKGTPPGPVTGAEQRRIARFKKTPQYKHAVADAKRHRRLVDLRNFLFNASGVPEHAVIPGDHNLPSVKRYPGGQTRYYLGDGKYGNATALRRATARAHSEFAQKHSVAGELAPALKVLDQTTRPVHAIAAGTKAAIEGKNVLHAAKQGVELKDKTLFSDVLKAAGAPKWIRGPGGFILDVAADPTTYTTFGVGSVAKHAAEKAGEKAYKRAIRAGLHEKVARKAGRKAAIKAAKKAPEGKGVQVRFAGRSTSGRATARVARRPAKAAKRVVEHPVVQRAGRDLSPRFPPKGVSEKEFDAVRGAARENRQHVTRGRFRAVQTAQALKDRIPEQDFGRVVNAIERGTTYDLPEHLRAPAQHVERHFKQARRAEVKAGLQVGSKRGYFAHQLKEALEETGARKGGTVPTRTVRPAFAKGRKYRGTIQQLKDEGIDFSEDIPLVVANRLSKSAVAVAKARFNRSLVKAGRKIKPGTEIRKNDDQLVARLHNGELELLSDAAYAKVRADAPGEFAVVSKGLVERAYNVVPGGDRNSVTRAFDKVQGGFKYAATMPNPGFHMRNLYGDIQNAYLAEALPHLIRNTGTSVRVLKALGREEEALRKLERHIDLKGSVKVKDHLGATRTLSYRELALEAEAAGAIRAGFFAKELPELLKDAGKGVTKAKSGAGRRISRLVQNREDVMRLTTYIGGRKRGLTPREAADRAARFHFDYGDMTDFERRFMRRLMPFYTFTRRNIPLQAKTLITKPGKYANIEKAREEAAKSLGLGDDWEHKLREYQQRGVPIPVRFRGRIIPLQPALPLTDLNQFTVPGLTTPSLWTSIDEQIKKGISTMTPLVKVPTELYANYSFFFRGDIEQDESPLVAAPSWVGQLPKAARKKLGIVPDYIDKRTGRKTWGWPAKVDYVAKQPPGPFNFFMQITTPGSSRRGQSTGAKAFSYLTGIKADPLDKEAVISTALDGLYDEKQRLEKQRNALSQRGIGSAERGHKETAEYRRIRDQIKKVDGRIYRLKKRRGDKILPTTGAPPKSGSLLNQSGGGGSLLDRGSSSTSLLD